MGVNINMNFTLKRSVPAGENAVYINSHGLRHGRFARERLGGFRVGVVFFGCLLRRWSLRLYAPPSFWGLCDTITNISIVKYILLNFTEIYQYISLDRQSTCIHLGKLGLPVIEQAQNKYTVCIVVRIFFTGLECFYTTQLSSLCAAFAYGVNCFFQSALLAPPTFRHAT